MDTGMPFRVCLGSSTDDRPAVQGHTRAMTHSLLIIDDDVALCELLRDYLQPEGFEVAAMHDGAEALQQLRTAEYDAIVLDSMLPGRMGLDVLRELRQFSSTPVLMLTARGDDTDRIVGLEMGADDYLAKPCNPRELVARLRAILRRARPGDADPPRSLSVGALSMDSSRRTAHYGKATLSLTSAEFNVLWALVAHAGDVISKDELCERALGRRLQAYDRSVDVHVSRLRGKLADLGNARSIVAVRGAGYQYVADDESP